MTEAMAEVLFWLGMFWLIGGGVLLGLGYLSGKRKGR